MSKNDTQAERSTDTETEITDEQLDAMAYEKKKEAILANTEMVTEAQLDTVPTDALAEVFNEALREERERKKEKILANSSEFTESMLDSFDDENLNDAFSKTVPAGHSMRTAGSFTDYVHANADDARDVRLVDSPEKGESVLMFDPRDGGSIVQVNASGTEHVRIVDLHNDPETAVDADPIYIAKRETTTGSFDDWQYRPEKRVIAINPEQLP